MQRPSSLEKALILGKVEGKGEEKNQQQGKMDFDTVQPQQMHCGRFERSSQGQIVIQKMWLLGWHIINHHLITTLAGPMFGSSLLIEQSYDHMFGSSCYYSDYSSQYSFIMIFIKIYHFNLNMCCLSFAILHTVQFSLLFGNFFSFLYTKSCVPFYIDRNTFVPLF